MPFTLNAFTGTATIGTTEWSMTTNTAGPDADTTTGFFQPFIDTANIAAGDVYEVAFYEKCRSGDTQRLLDTARIANAQSKPLWTFPPLPLGNGWDMTLKKVSGTDRAINWRITQVS